MNRVECVETSRCAYPDAILVHRGCTYHVTGIHKRKFAREGTENYTWYSLLETGTWQHHSSLFVMIEDEVEEIVNINTQDMPDEEIKPKGLEIGPPMRM